MQFNKTGVLLLQLGTPDSPTTADVRKYLRQFLMDARVIDIPYIQRQLLVNGIIANFRAPKSAKLYREIWTAQGSPLLIYGNALKNKLQAALGSQFVVELGMRYQSPDMGIALEKFRSLKVNELILLPLYPQFASSSTGSSLQKAFETISAWEVIPEIHAISSYFNHEEFIRLWAEKGKKFIENEYDTVLFTFHGVPWRHVRKTGCGAACMEGPKECPEINTDNHVCYRAQCFATARSISTKLGLPADKVKISFQSRLGSDPWLTPYTDATLIELAKSGRKRIVVFSPSFTADCLETIHEVGTEYFELFREHGGEKLDLVPSMNDDAAWVEFLKSQVLKRTTH
ncbi:MAG: ferrochelatase [Bacteroidetes bacterium]|nr:ferrochelatase [Bacteroidota bacterium]